VAKSRAQRKAEKRRREQTQQGRQPGRPDEADEGRAQQDTQMGVSGEVAEVEAVIETGARAEDFGETVVAQPTDEQAEAEAVAAAAEARTLDAPAPSRADVGRAEEGPADLELPPTDESRDERRARKEREKEQRRKARAKEQKKGTAGVEAPEKRRGAVMGFFASCWAELKKVQWPDRDTLVQASAVTVIFVVVAAAYLGALDAIFNVLVKDVLL
jgi:preprotein translocase subunit SecE